MGVFFLRKEEDVLEEVKHSRCEECFLLGEIRMSPPE